MKKQKICPNEHEHAWWAKDCPVCGIDEAGRGPLAGPLCCAAVVFECGYENPEIYDSKALSEKKREELFDVIQSEAAWFAVRIVSVEEIDRYNIYRADQRAFEELARDSGAGVILTDAMPLPGFDGTVIDFVKGDQKSISVAAASILAKVTRDRLMKEYDILYPQYGFARNKGYGTKEHMQAIETYGITPIHRRSFAPVRYKQTQLDLF